MGVKPLSGDMLARNLYYYYLNVTTALPQLSGPGNSPNDALLISDSETNCNNLNKYYIRQSNTTFLQLDALFTIAPNNATATSALISFPYPKRASANKFE